MKRNEPFTKTFDRFVKLGWKLEEVIIFNDAADSKNYVFCQDGEKRVVFTTAGKTREIDITY